MRACRRFRGRARNPVDQLVQPYACSSCAALNTKWHRAKADGADLRLRLDESIEHALVTTNRVGELEEALNGLRDELRARTHALEHARHIATKTHAGLEAEIDRLRAGPRPEVLSAEADAARDAERAARERAERAEAANEQLADEMASLRATATAAEELARRQRDESVAALEHARREGVGRTKALEEALREKGRLLDEEAAARAVADAAAAAAGAELRAENARRAERDAAAREELRRVKEQLTASDRVCEQQGSTIDEQRARIEALEAQRAQLEASHDTHRLQSTKLASAVARAQEAEGERHRTEGELRGQMVAAEAAAAAASAHAAAMECERDAALAAVPPPAAVPPAADIKELLSAVKIAVLAPCLRLHINGADPLHVGSAEQVDFGALGGMLEAAVLKRFSQVSLLEADTPLAQGGAHVIFPELKETMAHVQQEVKERLVAMMQSAGESPPPVAGAGGSAAAPPAEERPQATANGRRRTASGDGAARREADGQGQGEPGRRRSRQL